MPDASHAALLAVFVLATSIWVGGLVAIVLVARVTGRTVSQGDRVAFFRALGRVYGVVGGLALAVALGTGAALAHGHAWDGTLIATVAVAAALLAVTGVGVGQARRMTRLRRRALEHPDDSGLSDRVGRGARGAAALRGTIALLSLTLVALGAVLAS